MSDEPGNQARVPRMRAHEPEHRLRALRTRGVTDAGVDASPADACRHARLVPHVAHPVGGVPVRRLDVVPVGVGVVVQDVEDDDVAAAGATARRLEEDPVDTEQALDEDRKAGAVQHEGQAIEEAASGVGPAHRDAPRVPQSPDGIGRAAPTSPE